VALPQRVQRSDSWTQRMRERYNLDTSTFGYDPEGQEGQEGQGGGGGGGAPLITPKEQRQGLCALM
jgi:hypothetical protein